MKNATQITEEPEFKGAPKGTGVLLAAMFVAFFAGIGFLVASK